MNLPPLIERALSPCNSKISSTSRTFKRCNSPSNECPYRFNRFRWIRYKRVKLVEGILRQGFSKIKGKYFYVIVPYFIRGFLYEFISLSSISRTAILLGSPESIKAMLVKSSSPRTNTSLFSKSPLVCIKITLATVVSGVT